MNNAVHWQAVEHALALHGFDPARPLVAELDYRDPIDLGDAVEPSRSKATRCLRPSASARRRRLQRVTSAT